MSEKKPTITSLKREIERLNARLAAAESVIDRHWNGIRNNIYSTVDAQMRIKQAIAILEGRDE